MNPTVLRAAPVDIAGVADSLQQAFYDDPVMCHLFPDDASRRRRMARLFEIELQSHHLPLRSVWTTPDHAGAAMWSPPGHWQLPPLTLARNAVGLIRALGRNLPRTLRALATVEREHPREPHWYLAVLGTAPHHQGKGVGSSLLAPVLERCDTEGLPAYLESSKESNIPFYSRHGFEVRHEIQLPGGPKVWAMSRPPR